MNELITFMVNPTSIFSILKHGDREDNSETKSLACLARLPLTVHAYEMEQR